MQNLLQQHIQNGLPGHAHVAPNFGAPNFAAHGQAPGLQIPPPPPPPGAQNPQVHGVPAGHLGFPPPFVVPMQPQPVLPAVALGAGYMAPQHRTYLLAQLLGSTHGNSADAATRRAYAGVPTLSAPTLTPARVAVTPGTVHSRPWEAAHSRSRRRSGRLQGQGARVSRPIVSFRKKHGYFPRESPECAKVNFEHPWA
eukprot:8450_1